MALLKTNTGIGTTNPTSALHVIGDVLVTGVVTSTTFNGNINTGVATITTATITDLTNTRLTSGISTINNITNNFINSGVGTVNILNTGIGTVNNFNSTFVNISGVGSVANLHSPNAAINVGVITDLTNTRLTSGISTITDLKNIRQISGISSITTLYSSDAYINVGLVTEITGTRLNYTGVGTITTFDSDSAFINNLTSDYNNTGVGTVSLLNVGIATITDLDVTHSSFTNLNVDNLYAVTGVVTDISGTRLNYTGVGTITTLDTDAADINNLQSDYIDVGVSTSNILNSGIGTINNLNSTTFNVSGVGSIATLYSPTANINVGLVTEITGTRLNYTGIGTITNFNSSDAGIVNLDLQTLRVAGLSTFTNGPVLIGSGSQTGTINQNLQITGGAYISTYVGIGYTNPFSNLAIYDSNGAWISLVDPGQSSSAIENNNGTLYIRAEQGSGNSEIVFQTGTSNYEQKPSVSGSNRVKINNLGILLVNMETSSGVSQQNLQVSGGAYVSGYLGVGNSNPTSQLYVQGDTLVTGVVTATNFNGNINSTGISTLADIRAQRVTVTGIVTANSFRPTSGYIQAADGTNSFYIYNTTGNVAFQGTIGVNQINNASGFQVLTFNNLDTRLTGNLNIAGVTTSSVFNGNIYSLGVSTFRNGPVLIGTATSTGTSFQPLQVTGGGYISNNLGLGITTPTSKLDVDGDGRFTGVVTATRFDGDVNATNITSTNSYFTNLNANIANINVGIVTDISGTRLNYTGVGTITTLDTTNGTIDYLTNTDLTVSGIATITSLSVLTDFDVYDTTATFHNNLFVAGNLSIGGTASVIIAQDLQVLDKEITLGITTNAFNQDVSNDTTANHGGIAIASTEGYPLVDLALAGFSSLPVTYKQLMWVAANSYGVGTTDAWMFNYAVGVGSTQIPNNVRLAVGEVQITDHQINAVTGEFGRLISGIATFTGANISNLHSNNFFSQSGIITDLSGTRLNYTGFGTITNLYSVDAYIDDIASNVGFATAFTAERLNVSGVGTIATLNSTTSTITNLNATNSSFTNVNVNNLYAVTGIVTTLTSTHSTLENINSAGISTLNIVRTNTINSSGVVTAPTFVGDLLGVANYAHVSGYSTFSGYSNTSGFSTFSGYANIAGVSTFADYANNTGIATYAWTAGVSTYSGVAGYSTFSGYSDTSGFSTFSGYSNTSGFSTFSGYANVAGVSTFANYANNAGIATYTWTAGVSTYSGVAGYSTFSGYSNTSGFSTFSGYSNTSGISTSVIGGIASVTQLNVTGVATINQLDVNQLSPDGSNYGIINFVPVADGVGTWSWQPVTSAGAGTLDGITVREEGSTVGTAGSITNLDFRGNNIIVTAIPLGAIATITTSDTPTFDSLNVTGVSTLGFTTISSLYVAGVSTFSGITTFIGDVYIGGDLFVDDDIVFDEFTARNINVTGISSLNIVTTNEITSVGVVTAPIFVGDLLGVANYAHVSGYSTFSGYSDTTGFSTFSNYSNSAGVSTFADYANNAGIATYSWTAGVSTYSGVAGYSTFSGYSDTSGFSTFSGYSNTSGFSTFSNYSNSAGVSTFADYANNAGVATYSSLAGVSTSVIGGIASVTQLNVIGISTFGGNINASTASFSGNVTIGGTLTYEDVTNIDSIGVITARSDVRVDGNLSVIGITTLASGGGITTTGGDLFVGDDLNVAGDLNFNGILYQNGVKFTSGIGIGSTSVNPQSGVISPTDRIGIGFTDINIVGTGISIAGYGSTVVIDFGNISGGGGANVSISTIAPGISTSAGDLWWDSVNGDLKIYYSDTNSAQWIDANGGSQALAIISETSPTGYGITSGGTLWWDSTFGILKVYYDDGDSTQWVDANSGAYINFWVVNSAGIHTTGNVGVGTTTPTEKLQVNGQLSIDGNVSYGTTTFTTASTAQVGIHSALATATYRSVEYTIQATEGTNFHTTKIIALHDGSTAYHSEYGTIFNNVGISTYDVDVSGGKIRLLATPTSASTTNFKITYNGIKV